MAVGFSFAAVETSSAQLNEKRVERNATGIYNGALTNGKRIFFQNGQRQFTGNPPNGRGRVKVPVKDGRLKTAAKDNDIPGSNRAVLSGREKKSNVKRGGNLISVAANGEMDVRGDGENKWKRGKITGKLTKKGSKWNANTKMEGTRNEGGDFSSKFITTARGKG